MLRLASGGVGRKPVMMSCHGAGVTLSRRTPYTWISRSRRQSNVIFSSMAIDSWPIKHGATQCDETPPPHNQTVYDYASSTGEDAVAEQHFQTLLERISTFPVGVKRLSKDLILSMHIEDASKTPLNAWTVDHPIIKRNRSNQQMQHQSQSQPRLVPGRIPRRQFEQLRKVQKDMQTMLPLLVIFCQPIIGYIPTVLALTSPRQVLSDHFHNEYEIEAFAQIEYNQRREAYDDLADMLWNSVLPSNVVKKTVLINDIVHHLPQDGAGPILDSMRLYPLFSAGVGCFTCIDDLPRDYLLHFSLAIGVNQHLPDWMSRVVAEWTPSIILKKMVNERCKVVYRDDGMLLEEGYHLSGCVSLTDVELLNACLMRGLPVTSDTSIDERRQCLTNHLNMISQVKQRLAIDDRRPTQDEDRFALFTMHLAPIRYALKRAMMTSR